MNNFFSFDKQGTASENKLKSLVAIAILAFVVYQLQKINKTS